MKRSSQHLSSQILKEVSKQNSTHTQKGLNRLSALLHKMPKSQRSSLLDQLSGDPPSSDQHEPEEIHKVEEVREIPFDHLSSLSSIDFQKVFEGINRVVWLKALKIAEPEFKDFVLSSVSVRIRGDVEEELAYLGPVRLSDAQDAQKQIIDYARSLEDQGEIHGLSLNDDESWL